MQEVLLYVQINLLCAFIFLMLLIKSFRESTHDTSQLFFRGVLGCCILLFAVDCISNIAVAQHSASLRALIITANTWYFIIIGVVTYLWYRYSECSINPTPNKSRASSLLEMAPMLILAVVALTTPKTGWLFFVTEDGLYFRGPMHSLQVVICFGYLAVSVIVAVHRGRQSRDYDLRRRMFVLATFPLPVLIAGLLQIFLPDLPLICCGTVLSLLYIHTETRDHLISIDALTQINGRNQLFRYLTSQMDDASKAADDEEETGCLCLLMLDVDKFKQINDKYGHVEGDSALIHLARALKRACENTPSGIYRYGGDEFIICFTAEGDQDIEDMQARINNALSIENRQIEAPYNVEVSIGVAKYNPSLKTPNEFIKLADEELYKNKQALKKAREAGA